MDRRTAQLKMQQDMGGSLLLANMLANQGANLSEDPRARAQRIAVILKAKGK